MSKFIFVLILAVAAGSIWYWYDNRDSFVVGEAIPSSSAQPEPVDIALDAPDGSYRLASASSSMTWQGSRPLIKGYYDRGVVDIAEGVVTIENGRVASGSIIVNLTTITAQHTGRGDALADRLSRHLMSVDFFDVEQYPTSTFRLTDLQARTDSLYLVSGELTIKGATHPVTFTAAIMVQDNQLVMDAENIQLNRTLWDLHYGSGSFFDNLGDELIDDIVTISFHAVGIFQQDENE